MQRFYPIFVSALFCLALGCNGTPTGPSSSDEPGVSTAKTTVPIFGNEAGSYTAVGPPDASGNIPFNASASGIFSHTGVTTSQSNFQISVLNGYGAGTSTFTAANGDQIRSNWTSTPSGPSESTYMVTVDGGTGRFADATGTITGTVSVVRETAFSGTSTASWQGTISY